MQYLRNSAVINKNPKMLVQKWAKMLATLKNFIRFAIIIFMQLLTKYLKNLRALANRYRT